MIDFTLWDLKGEFTLKEVASLFCEVDGKLRAETKEKRHEVYLMEDVLKEAIRKGDLKYTASYPNQDIGGKDDYFSREVLIAYADRVRKKPLFLFPEERESKQTNNKENLYFHVNLALNGMT